METLASRISSYNLFNYLLPGILFVSFGEKISSYEFVESDMVVSLFTYYFIGMVISRLGSHVLSPFMKKVGFVTFAEYDDYLIASKNDPKIDILSESNNSYRTLCAMFLSLALLKIVEALSCYYGLSLSELFCTLITALFILFAFSYRKQTNFIVARVSHGIKEGNNA